MYLNNGEKIQYIREARPRYPDYNIGYFSIREWELQEIKTIAGLIEVLEKGELLHLDDGDWIDIDDFCKMLIKENGKDFVPNENEEFYVYENDPCDLEHPYGMTGEKLVKYWDCYQENQKEKQAFIKKIKKIEKGKADRLVMEKIYESFGAPMDDFYEDEIYSVNIR